jgi:hypothetical protein
MVLSQILPAASSTERETHLMKSMPNPKNVKETEAEETSRILRFSQGT